MTTPRLLGALVSFAGVALIVLSSNEGAFGSQTVGNVLTLIAAVCWAAYVAFGAPVLRRHSPLRTTAWAIVFGTFVMLPIGALQLAGTNWSAVTLASPLALLYAGLLSAAVGNVVHFRSVQRVGPSRTANLQFLVPAIAVVLAAVLLGEQIRVEQVIGGVIIVLGNPGCAGLGPPPPGAAWQLIAGRQGGLSRPTSRSCRRCAPAICRCRSSSTTTARSP